MADETQVKTGETVSRSGKYQEENSDNEVTLNEGDMAPDGQNGPATFTFVSES